MSTKRIVFSFAVALLVGGTAGDAASDDCDSQFIECVRSEWNRCHAGNNSDEYCRSYMHYYMDNICSPQKAQCRGDVQPDEGSSQ